MRTDLFVKICGITRSEDADLACELGASALGFIFWDGSPRCVDARQAKAIAHQKPGHVSAVGVFVNESPARIRELVDEVGLNAVQLHGNETAAMCNDLLRASGPGTPALAVIKAVGLTDNTRPVLDQFDERVVILLDAHDPVRHGGTGRRVDWELARNVAASRRTILSGGLNPDNVKEAAETVHPFGLDVSSGVESNPGIKDAAKLRRFFEALND